MADLLGEVDMNIPSRLPMKTLKTATRHKTRVLSQPISQTQKNPSPNSSPSKIAMHILNTPPLEPNYNVDISFPDTLDMENFPMHDEVPSSPTIKAVERKGQQTIKAEHEDDDDVMDVAQATGNYSVKSDNVNISGSRPMPKVKKDPYPSPKSSSPIRPSTDNIDPSTWNQVTSRLNVVSSQSSEVNSHTKLQTDDAIEADGSVRMFWTDYTEVNGSLCLFGKVKDKHSGTYVSAFVKVDNIFRKLYFLPRTYRQREDCRTGNMTLS